jgi:Predicted pPIWI-associating nuclease
VSPENREAWDQLWSDVDYLRSGIGRSKAVNVNASRLRGQAQEVVQLYFREVRPELLAIGIGEEELRSTDGEMQALLQLSQGRNVNTSYVRVLRNIGRQHFPLAALRERRLGEATPLSPPGTGAYGDTERRILATLKAMLPDAAASYEQAIIDLRDPTRRSWRGTAVEFREVVREVLDHLAPDDEVKKEPSFGLERDRIAPTMRQKAGFVLRSRDLSGTSRKAPQDAIGVVDELTASFVRSTYERGSASTHGAPEKREIERLKMYVDTVLMELLETEPHVRP